MSGLLYRKFLLYPRIRRHLEGRVLDVGCGIGDFLSGCRGATGVDVNLHAVEWCRRQGLNARIMDFDILPFADQYFGSVVLDNVLEHIEQPQPLLKEIRRVLVPGGKFVIGVPGLCGYKADSDHKSFYDWQRLEQIVSRVGFGEITHFYMPLRSDWLEKKLSQYCLYGVFARC